MPLTGQQRAELLKKAEAGGGEGLRAILDMIVDLYLRTDPVVSDRPKVRKVIEKLATNAGLLPGKNGGAQRVQGGGEAPLPPRGGVRMGANGEPLDPAQQALEEQMDAAIGGGGGGGQTAAPGPTYDGGVRLGADGTPLSPEQQAIEEQMDAASR